MKTIIEGKVFNKRYEAYNYFSELIGKKYNEDSSFRVNGVMLQKLNRKLREENIIDNERGIIALTVIEKNSNEDNEIWTESINKKALEYNKHVKYEFLLKEKANKLQEKNYEFLGLYGFIEYDDEREIRKWRKYVFPNNEIPLDEDEIIKIIKKLEKE